MEGEDNPPAAKRVNICLDAAGRTLLAWSGMAIIYAVWNPAKYQISWPVPQRRTQRAPTITLCEV